MEKTLTIALQRNLRRSILRGHPWVYRDSIATPKFSVPTACLCKIVDNKNDFVAWGMYNPHSPLALRILSLDRKAPDLEFWYSRLQKANDWRALCIDANTNCFRLLNGEGDLVPGLVCDIYADIAVMQFDGQGPSEFWMKHELAKWIFENMNCRAVVEKHRRSSEETDLVLLAGEAPSTDPHASFSATKVEVKEHGVRFVVDVANGQKTGFFLDQRENRAYIRSISKGKSVLNLFSYTGGFSMYAGAGGASRVASLDVASGAIQTAENNWRLNGLDPKLHTGMCVDVFEYLAHTKEVWDHVIVDPPSMGHNESHKQRAFEKYVEVFASAAKRVAPKGGHLSLSSCSSHISFIDFQLIIEEALSVARRKGQVMRISGQGPDHPFPHACEEMRYLKFVHLVLD